MYREMRSAGIRSLAAGVAAAVVGALTVTLSAGVAQADTAPVAPETRTTVAADALPTVQINGVVWAQVIVGTRVYATGSFPSARPAGAPSGTLLDRSLSSQLA